MSSRSDFFRSRPGHALIRKMFLRRGQDASRGHRILYFLSSCRHSDIGSLYYLTNWLV
jgi:hypothetical protein